MKKRICLILAIISMVFVSCSRTTSLTVDIPEVSSGKVYVIYADPEQINNRQQDVLAQKDFTNGKITIEFDSLKFDKSKIKECALVVVNEQQQFSCNLPLPIEKGKKITVTISGVKEYLNHQSNLKVSYSGSKQAEDFSDFWQKVNKTFVDLSQGQNNTKIYQEQVNLYKDYLKKYPDSGFPYSIILGQLSLISNEDSNPVMQYCAQLSEQKSDNPWLNLLIAAYKDKKIKAVTSKELVFSAQDNNNKIYTERNVKGKLILVDFWATWCKPCQESIPKLKSLYTKYHSRGLEIVSISLDTNPNDWTSYIQKNPFPWLSLIGNGKEITQRYDFQYIPYVILADEHGKILKSNIQVEELEKFIDSYLSK